MDFNDPPLTGMVPDADKAGLMEWEQKNHLGETLHMATFLDLSMGAVQVSVSGADLCVWLKPPSAPRSQSFIVLAMFIVCANNPPPPPLRAMRWKRTLK